MTQNFNFIIRSGGQSGVDIGTLDAAKDFNNLKKDLNEHNKIIDITGWCPKGRKSENGPIPTDYPLKETKTAEYSERTELNIKDSEATLILLLEKNNADKGTQYTIDKAKEYQKPFKIIILNENLQENIQQVVNWLNGSQQINHLNVGGPRESNAKGIYAKAYEFIFELLNEIKCSKKLNKWCDSFNFDHDDAENKTALEIKSKFEASDAKIPDLPEISQAHSGAIYTSRLLNFRNISGPLNSKINQSTSDSKQINLFISEDKFFGDD
ncbi:10130_t:CDS:2 [Cetraspora pellucida]|uniref:10130_t:CDS:1 n=1 Tax=Cetraspora pellucida TaxID=1433469 RepID=A0A9N8ZKI3_9GLOM|nr:10130_t:CDS:2 [Cetraspora pellucida]